MVFSEKAAAVVAEEQPELADENEEEMNIILPNDPKDENVPDDTDFEPEIHVISSDLGIQEVCIWLKIYKIYSIFIPFSLKLYDIKNSEKCRIKALHL